MFCDEDEDDTSANIALYLMAGSLIIAFLALASIGIK